MLAQRKISTHIHDTNPRDAEGGTMGVVLLGPGGRAEDAAARLGIPVGDFWRELDAGRVLTLYLRLPEEKKPVSRHK